MYRRLYFSVSDGQLNYREQNTQELVGFLLFDHTDTFTFISQILSTCMIFIFFFIAYKNSPGCVKHWFGFGQWQKFRTQLLVPCWSKKSFYKGLDKGSLSLIRWNFAHHLVQVCLSHPCQEWDLRNYIPYAAIGFMNKAELPKLKCLRPFLLLGRSQKAWNYFLSMPRTWETWQLHN